MRVFIIRNITGPKPTIYCVDLIFNDWVKFTDKELQFEFGEYLNPCLGGDYVYFLETFDGVHFKIKLNDMVPKTIKIRHIERNQLIVSGYIHSVKDLLTATIPDDLIKLLFAFFSQFLICQTCN